MSLHKIFLGVSLLALCICLLSCSSSKTSNLVGVNSLESNTSEVYILEKDTLLVSGFFEKSVELPARAVKTEALYIKP